MNGLAARQETQIGWLKVGQQHASLKNLAFDKPDVVILFSSTEPRCLAITEIERFGAPSGIIVRFAERSSHPARIRHDKLLYGFLKSRVVNVIAIDGYDSTSWRSVYESVLSKLATLAKQLARPLNIGFDISCCPKAHFLSILAAGLSSGLLGRVDVFYSTAEYKSEKTEGLDAIGEDEAFSQGAWQPALIPFLEGEVSPGHRRTIIAALGYEAQRSRIFIRAYQPDRCIFFVPHAAESDKQHLKALAAGGPDRYKSLFEDFAANPDEIIPLHGGDLIGVVKQLEVSFDHLEQDEVMLFALGTKPHALGFCFYAVAHRRIPVIPRIPEIYLPMGNDPDGMGWIYNVSDLSSPARRN